MPISDLLASITGEKPKLSTAPTSTTTTATTKTTAGPAKRKADDDLGGSAQKSQRTAPLANGSVRSGDGAAGSPRQTDRPAYTGSAAPKSSLSQPTSSKSSTASLARKAVATPSKPSPTTPSFSHGSRPSTVNSPSAARPNNVSSPKPGLAGGSSSKAQPKKGSYAEIMARAKAAQATMGAVGKIQHKALDKVPTKREREELKAEQARALKKGIKPQSTRPGQTRPGANGSAGLRDRDMDRHRDGNNGLGRFKDDRKPVNGKSARAVEEDRKLKKAATATTGYTGTARPPPGASKAGASSKATAPNGSHGRPQSSRPYGAFSARRNRDDDYDEELDDFIEYDDDDEPEYGGGRRGYGGYSEEEDESDMEAGLSDIDDEERRAEVYARKEDRREEELEKRLKREKEERKRRLLEGR